MTMSIDAAPNILELRIHGVLNDPPAAILGVPPELVQQVEGDKLTGFYTVADPASSLIAASAKLATGVRREAYSWGWINRYAPTAGNRFLGIVGRILTKIAWLLLIPFGLCNAAYWARSLPRPRSDTRDGWRGGAGGAATRIFALTLTLLYVTSFASASLDLIGVQCFPGSPETSSTGGGICSQLPGFMDFLASWPRGARLALLSLVPILAVVVLQFVSAGARVRYEANVADGEHDTTLHGVGDVPSLPVLSTPRFWNHKFIVASSGRLHLAASMTLIAGLLFWDKQYAGHSGSNNLATTVGHGFGTWDGIATPGLIGAAGLMIYVVVLLVTRTGTARDIPTPDRSRARSKSGRIHADYYTVCALSLAGGIYLWAAIAEATDQSKPGSQQQPFLGLIVAPTTLVIIAFALAVAGLGWRRGLGTAPSLALAAAFLVGMAGVLAVIIPGSRFLAPLGWVGALIAALALAIWIFLWIRKGRRGDSEHQAWRGAAPGVVMFLALGASMILGSLIVVGTATFLMPPQKTTTPAGGCVCQASATDHNEPTIITPRAYAVFGVLLLFLAIVVAVTVALVLAIRLRDLWVLSAPAYDGVSVPDAALSDYWDSAELDRYGGSPARGRPPKVRIRVPRVARLILRQRRTSALAQTGEPLLAVVAWATAVGILLTLAISACQYLLTLPGGAKAAATSSTQLAAASPVAAGIASFTATITMTTSIAAWTLGTTALLAIAAIIASSSTSRPFELLWDLICFLPRAGHPYGPPCYAARSVPEIQGRIIDWLRPDGQEADERRVIISPHSQGAVLGVAVVLSMCSWTVNRRELSKVAMLSYGTQLRPYFGRFFPELLGPIATGGRPCLRPSLFHPDPWLKQVIIDQPNPHRGPSQQPPQPDTLTVKTALSSSREVGYGSARCVTRWKNLWRRTDFIGFPADSYGDSDIDVGADELDRSSYLLATATHFNYPASRAYETELNRLISNLTEYGTTAA